MLNHIKLVQIISIVSICVIWNIIYYDTHQFENCYASLKIPPYTICLDTHPIDLPDVECNYFFQNVNERLQKQLRSSNCLFTEPLSNKLIEYIGDIKNAGIFTINSCKLVHILNIPPPEEKA
jgi:hypothetical protein